MSRPDDPRPRPLPARAVVRARGERRQPCAVRAGAAGPGRRRARRCSGCSRAPTRSRRRCPTKETLTGQLTFTTLLNVLLFVVWLAWLFFVVCVVVEIVAARRGGLAQPVPLGGPVQKLARALVGALLLAEVISGPAASAVAPAEHSGAEVAAAASVVQEAPGGVARDQCPGAAALGARDHGAGAPGRAQGLHGGRTQGRLPRQPLGHRRATAGRRPALPGDLRAEQGPGPARRPQARAGAADPARLEPGRARRRRRRQPDDRPAHDRHPGSDRAPLRSRHRSDAASVAEPGVQEMPGGLLGTGLLAATALAALAFERRRRIGARSRQPKPSRPSCGARPPRRVPRSSTVRCAT